MNPLRKKTASQWRLEEWRNIDGVSGNDARARGAWERAY